MDRVPREAILNSITEGMIIMDPSGTMVTINPAARVLFGCSVKEAGQRLFFWSDFFEATHFDGRPIEPGEWPISRALRGESFTNCEIVIRDRRRGAESWVGNFNANPVRDQHGQTICIIITVRDVTSSKRAEESLRECGVEFWDMVDTAPVMIWRSTATDRLCTFFNRKWLNFRGRTMEQELGQGWTEGVHGDDLERVLAVYKSSFDEHGPFNIEYRLRRSDAEYRWILDQAVPQFSYWGKFVGYTGLCSDITELRTAKQDALARQNLETIGVLAAGIAHDFNNLLGGILAEAELAFEDLPAGAAVPEGIQKIKTVALRGSEIVRELMIYAGQETGSLEPIDIARLTGEMVQLIRISVSKHVRIETTFAADLPAIQANAAQIRQVIMNLVINASEAIGDVDGTIRLATRQDGDCIQIEVADTGQGMDAEIQTRIFDPFFTTKSAGRGRGLAVVQAVVHNHGGSIQVETAPGRGTTFRILLPSAKIAPAEHPAGPQPGSRSTVKGTILMVEDEPTMLLSVSKMLRKRGFTILEASDGSAAIRLLQSEGNTIDIMVLDVTIPGKSSRDVFAEARRFHPDIKIILTTAYSEGVAGSSLSWPRVEGFIRKPYEIGSLEQLIERVMSNS